MKSLRVLFIIAGLAISCVSSVSGDTTPVTLLDLQKCIDIVIRNSTTVLQNANQNDLNGVLVLEAYGQFLPNLQAAGGYGYSWGTTLYTVSGPTVVNSKSQNASISISTTLNLFNGLADYAGLKSALARKSASDYSLGWAKEQIALDITQTYLQLVLDQQILDIAQKNLVASNERLKLLQGQSQVGQTSISDLYRQQAETSAAEFVVSNDEARVQDDRVLLIRKLRVDPEKPYQFQIPILDPAKSPPLGKNLEELVKETLATRPDVKSNASLVDSTDWDVTRARSGYLPRLDLVFARDSAGAYLNRDIVNGADALAGTQQANLGSQLGNQVQYSVSLNLSWNIFDRFVTKYNVAQADTILKNTQIAFEDSKFQVSADIKTAYTNYGSAQKQLNSARVGLESAQKSYDAVEGMYEVGNSSIVDVLTAQAALVQARSNWAQALTNLKLQEKTLQYATGTLVSSSMKPM